MSPVPTAPWIPAGTRVLPWPRQLELIALAQAGDRDAMEELTRTNLPMVVATARRAAARLVSGGAIDLDDAIAAAALAFRAAVLHFDPARGTRLSTYAGRAMWERVRRLHRSQGGPVHLPHGKYDRAAASRAMAAETWSSDVCLGQLAARPDDGPEPDQADADRAEIARLLARLTPAQREAIVLRFGLGVGEPMSLPAIAGRMGCTKQWAGVLVNGAIERMREEVRRRCSC